MSSTASFFCSDPAISGIFETGREALRRSVREAATLDFARMRRRAFGSEQLDALAAQSVLGDSSLFETTFFNSAAPSETMSGAHLLESSGNDAIGNDRQLMPASAALFVISALDYYYMTGDGSLVRGILPTMLDGLRWLGSFGSGEGGLLAGITEWNFQDWVLSPAAGSGDVDGAVNLYYLLALRAMSRLAGLSGDEAVERSYGLQANGIAAAFDSLFWNPAEGVYVDCMDDGLQSTQSSRQVNSLAVLAEVGSETRTDHVAEQLSGGRLAIHGLHPYFDYLAAQALASTGRLAEALQFIIERWERVADSAAGAAASVSTASEWSIGASVWLLRHVLGVTPREPGFATVDVAPKLCGLDWARGGVPIPQGDVQVSWLRKGRKLTVDVTVPTGVLLRPILPCAPNGEILIDGQSAREDQIVRRTPISAEIAVLPGSGYHFEVSL